MASFSLNKIMSLLRSPATNTLNYTHVFNIWTKSVVFISIFYVNHDTHVNAAQKLEIILNIHNCSVIDLKLWSNVGFDEIHLRKVITKELIIRLFALNAESNSTESFRLMIWLNY